MCHCDSCGKIRKECRLLPYGGDGNMILCRSCHKKEMDFRHSEMLRIKDATAYELPRYDTLKIYDGCI